MAQNRHKARSDRHHHASLGPYNDLLQVIGEVRLGEGDDDILRLGLGRNSSACHSFDGAPIGGFNGGV